MLHRPADRGSLPAAARRAVCDMCDRVYTHMGPALEKMTAQALRESGRDEKDAKRLTALRSTAF